MLETTIVLVCLLVAFAFAIDSITVLVCAIKANTTKDFVDSANAVTGAKSPVLSALKRLLLLLK
jgi:hypothetical protein